MLQSGEWADFVIKVVQQQKDGQDQTKVFNSLIQ
jgi:hypothetical protein